MLDPSDRILIGIVAATDAIHWPQRDPSARSWSRFAVARTACRAWGVPWTATAAADHERRAERDALAGLIADDLILRASSPGDRIIRLRLTDAGESRARGLAGLPSLAESFAAMRRLAKLQRTSPEAVCNPSTSPPGWWTRETTVAGKDYPALNRERPPFKCLRRVAERLLPMLLRGWIESNSDNAGHVCYRVTDAGLSALPSPPTFTASDAERDDEAVEHYAAAFNRASERIASVDEPSGRGEIGPVPLPSSMSTRREWRKWQSDPEGMLERIEKSSAAAVGDAK